MVFWMALTVLGMSCLMAVGTDMSVQPCLASQMYLSLNLQYLSQLSDGSYE